VLKAYTAKQIRDAETPLLAAGEPLMARAAAGLAGEIEAVLSSREASTRGRVVLLVGSGNNGGDALFAGAMLAAAGRDVVVAPVGSRMHAGGLEAAVAAGATVVSDLEADAVERLGRSAHVIVDAILGIGDGNSPALRPPARAVVETLLPIVLAADGPAVVAVDIPSGIGPDDGSVPDEAVLPADLTVTFGGLKAGLFRQPVRRLAGRVVLVDVGLASALAAMTPALELPDA
jgi:hydroxyethylthiazole kinase-like uncharacterized protein yjeF